MEISGTSYCAPLWPSASTSSHMTLTFPPTGALSEYSYSGWRPTSNSLSCVEPVMGRLILANWPPLYFLQGDFGRKGTMEIVFGGDSDQF